jgi:hypothetical protein
MFFYQGAAWYFFAWSKWRLARARERSSRQAEKKHQQSVASKQLLTRGRKVSEIAQSGCVKAKLVGDGMDAVVDA